MFVISYLFRLNIDKQLWELISHNAHNSPRARYEVGIVQDSHFIYQIGGSSEKNFRRITHSLDVLPAFSLYERTWHEVSTKRDPLAPRPGIPAPRSNFSCVQYQTLSGQNEVCITGGLRDTTAYDDIWILNLTMMQWRLFRTSRLLHPLYHHDASIDSNGLMRIIGGLDVTDTHRYNQKIFKVWLKMPKLAEMCWEAVVHYNPLIHHYTSEQLRWIGVPEQFIQRIVPR